MSSYLYSAAALALSDLATATTQSPNCSTLPSQVSAWSAAASHYNDGDFVIHSGITWEAKWWTNAAPGQNVPSWTNCSTPSQPGGDCPLSGKTVPQDIPAWQQTSHAENSFVSYEGQVWRTKWWTAAVPKAGEAAWEYCGELSGGSAPATVAPPVIPDSSESSETGGCYWTAAMGSWCGASKANCQSCAPTNPAEGTTYLQNGQCFWRSAQSTGQNEADCSGTWIEGSSDSGPVAPATTTVAPVTEAPTVPVTEAPTVPATEAPITQTEAPPAPLTSSDRVLAGYMPNAWNAPVKVSEAAQKGYNICIPAFIVVEGSSPVQFFNNVWLAYSGWSTTAEDPAVVEAIKADIRLAKQQYGLKYVLPSVGGGNNTFRPGNVSAAALAENMVNFLQRYDFDGLDLDLEALPAGITEGYLVSLIEAMKQRMPSIIISAAPQVNNVNGSLQYVNTGFTQVYNSALAKGLINYMFVQEYNTPGNYVNEQGNIVWSSNDGADQTSAQFIVNSFHALKKITPSSTVIVPGQPSTPAGASTGSVFYGSDSADPYNAMARAYAELVNEPQFGGAMTWEVSADKTDGWKFANAMHPAINGGRALSEKPRRFLQSAKAA